MKIYFVTFEVRVVGCRNQMIYHCMANNAKEAKEKAKKFWASLSGIDGRPYYVYANKSRAQDVKYLRVVGWEGTEYKADYVMNHVFCTESKPYWGKR